MSERLSRLTLRVEVAPHWGAGRSVEQMIQMDFPTRHAEDLGRLQRLFADVMADLQDFYGVSDIEVEEATP